MGSNVGSLGDSLPHDASDSTRLRDEFVTPTSHSPRSAVPVRAQFRIRGTSSTRRVGHLHSQPGYDFLLSEFPGRIAIFSNDLTASLRQVVQVASDAEPGCALRADKTVACWGGAKAQADGAPVAIAELTDVPRDRRWQPPGVRASRRWRR